MCEAKLTDEKLLEIKEFRKNKLSPYVQLAEALRNDYIQERKLDKLRSVYKKKVEGIENLYNNFELK